MDSGIQISTSGRRSWQTFPFTFLTAFSSTLIEMFKTYIFFDILCSYEEEELKKFVLHLLVLSHSYLVPPLKRVCMYHLEQGWLTKENVIDVLQLARMCDAPRLSLICIRMAVKDFKSISLTEGWKVMKRANPALEQELVESVVEEDSVSQLLFLFWANSHCLINLN